MVVGRALRRTVLTLLLVSGLGRADDEPATTGGNKPAVDAAARDRDEPEREVPEPELAEQLVLKIEEYGPRRPWVVRIKNYSQDPVNLTADIRLVWFEVDVPGKKEPERCRLPKNLLARAESGDRRITLAPGKEYRQLIDPRFYCFSDGHQERLVPGARVAPRFGWPEKTRTLWRRGKRIKQIRKPRAPFVAWPLVKGDTQSPDAKTALKTLRAPPFTLGADYESWFVPKPKPGDEAKDDESAASLPPLKLTMRRGSDAANERDTTVNVAVQNQSNAAMRLYLRREHITFEVMGPTGLGVCASGATDRDPDPQAYLKLSPGKSFDMTTRLVEFCPRGMFNRPGVYLVSAVLKATHTGRDFGLNAFVGEIATFEPVAVRVRTGEQPFLVIRRRPAPGAAPAAPGAAPAAPGAARAAPPAAAGTAPAPAAPTANPAPPPAAAPNPPETPPPAAAAAPPAQAVEEAPEDENE